MSAGTFVFANAEEGFIAISERTGVQRSQRTSTVPLYLACPAMV